MLKFFILVYKVDEAVKVMLTMAPQMVLIPDLKQNYPLHIAIRHRQNYHVIHVLHKAIPDTGKICDAKTKLLPFMLAALGAWNDDADQLNVSYRLLREDPFLVFHA